MRLRLTAMMVGIAVGCINAHAQTTKIGYISEDRLLHESPAARAVEVRLRAEFAVRERDLRAATTRLQATSESLEHESASLPEVDRTRRQRELVEFDREVRRKRRDFQNDLARRKDQELSAFQERVNAAIRHIGENEGYDLILEHAHSAGPRVDITDRVIDSLNVSTQR